MTKHEIKSELQQEIDEVVDSLMNYDSTINKAKMDIGDALERMVEKLRDID